MLNEEALCQFFSDNYMNKVTIDGKKVFGFKLKLVQRYEPYDSNPDYDTIYYAGESRLYDTYAYNLSDTTLSKDYYMYIPKSDVTFTYHAEVKPTCTEPGHTAYWTDKDGNKLAGVNNDTPLTDEDIFVAALGHDWGEWEVTTPATCEEAGEETRTCTHDASHKETREKAALDHDWGEWTTTKEPTETEAGEEERVCKNDANHKETREIPVLTPDRFFTADSQFTWTKGSKDGLFVVIKNKTGDDTATFDKFVDVYVDGSKLTRDTDYTAEPGSIEITLSAAYLQSLDAGKHALKVELTVTTIEHTFTVAQSSGTDTPSTGESGAAVTLSMVLMMLAAYGAVYAFSRRRMVIG